MSKIKFKISNRYWYVHFHLKIQMDLWYRDKVTDGFYEIQLYRYTWNLGKSDLPWP